MSLVSVYASKKIITQQPQGIKKCKWMIRKLPFCTSVCTKLVTKYCVKGIVGCIYWRNLKICTCGKRHVGTPGWSTLGARHICSIQIETNTLTTATHGQRIVIHCRRTMNLCPNKTQLNKFNCSVIEKLISWETLSTIGTGYIQTLAKKVACLYYTCLGMISVIGRALTYHAIKNASNQNPIEEAERHGHKWTRCLTPVPKTEITGGEEPTVGAEPTACKNKENEACCSHIANWWVRWHCRNQLRE